MSATFTDTPVIWIQVDESAPGRHVEHLHDRLFVWLAQNRIQSKLPEQYTAKFYRGGFAPDDAERVIAWLRANGCVERRSG